jgi:kynurenine 3-monooxygenase
MSLLEHPKFIVVGAGPAGAMVAAYLGQAGYQVEVYEMRDDLRNSDAPGGRSINLALSLRGIAALERIGIADRVLATAVPMPGRMIHGVDGTLTFQPYGKDATQAIHSVSRGDLNRLLLETADQHESVRLLFHKKCIDVDIDHRCVELVDTQSGERSTVTGDIIVSADGAFSAVRRSLQKRDRFDYRQDYLLHGYKELAIPPGPNGEFRLEKNALHIWPRREFMMIALPNEDASYTCTLFWPFEGPNSFAAIDTEEKLLNHFNRCFPDAVAHMPTLVEDYFANPVGSLATIRCAPWYIEDKVVLLGDACHAVVPFYGQGMNAAFEDVLVLGECVKAHAPHWRRVFEVYYQTRKVHVDTLADMAISNFLEMRDHTGSRKFLRKKQLEKTLHRLFPKWYFPLYTLATFTRMPYLEAVRRTKKQDRIVRGIGWGLALIVLTILAAIVW